MAGNSGADQLRIRAKSRQYEGFDREHEGTWQGPFTFIASADPQYGLIARWNKPGALDWKEEVELTRRGVDKINKMKPRPRFVVILGDMLDAMPDVQASGCKHLVIFQHTPWFIKSPDEDDGYFNIPITHRLPVLERFLTAGVRIIFCGHYHRNAGGLYKGMEEVVTSAWGMPTGEDKSGLRVVKVTEDSISHQYYSVDEIPFEC